MDLLLPPEAGTRPISSSTRPQAQGRRGGDASTRLGLFIRTGRARPGRGYPAVRLTGCDPNDSAIDWATEHLPRIDFLVSPIAVLEAAQEVGARRVVNTSTGGGLYGDADDLPTPRTTRSGPSRRMARESTPAKATASSTRDLHGLSTVSLRYGNVYGPRQDVHGEAGVVAIFCGVARQRAADRPFSATAAKRAMGRGGRRRPCEPVCC